MPFSLRHRKFKFIVIETRFGRLLKNKFYDSTLLKRKREIERERERESMFHWIIHLSFIPLS